MLRKCGKISIDIGNMEIIWNFDKGFDQEMFGYKQDCYK